MNKKVMEREYRGRFRQISISYYFSETCLISLDNINWKRLWTEIFSSDFKQIFYLTSLNPLDN